MTERDPRYCADHLLLVTLEEVVVPERPFHPDQPYLLPPSVLEWVPPQHLSHFILTLLQRLTAAHWREMGIDPVPATKGEARYAPAALLGICLLGVASGIRSSRKLERACHESLPFRVVSGNQCPDHNTLHRFLRVHEQACARMFARSVQLADEIGIVGWEVQAIDGTKIQANANAGRARTRAQLEAVQLAVETRIAAIIQRDEDEAGDPPDLAELPADLTDPVVLGRAIQERLATLELTLPSDHDPDDDGDSSAGTPLPRLPADATSELRRLRRQRDRIQRAQARMDQRDREKRNHAGITKVSLTDPDALPIKTGFGIHQRDNGQLVVRPIPEGGRLIVAADVVSQGNDFHQLLPMLDQATASTGRPAELTLADAGYHTGAAVQGCHDRGARVVMPIPDRRKKHLAIGTDDFVHDPERDVLICPEGQVVPFRRLQEHEDRQVRVYQAPAAVCHACSRYRACVPPRDQDDRKGRMVRKSLHHLAMGEHRSWMATA